jgi:hypothetical protein
MNRFDIIHAHYLWNKWNHGGQGSKEYARLCRISRYYTPARSAEDSFENLEQVEIYETLAEKKLGRSFGYTACLCCAMDTVGMGLCFDCEKADCSVSGNEVCNHADAEQLDESDDEVES